MHDVSLLESGEKDFWHKKCLTYCQDVRANANRLNITEGFQRRTGDGRKKRRSLMRCSVCKSDFSGFSMDTVSPEQICSHCASLTGDSFIFHCLNCGTCDVIDKEMAIVSAPNHDIKRQLLLLKNDNVIIEQDSCPTCVGVHVC